MNSVLAFNFNNPIVKNSPLCSQKLSKNIMVQLQMESIKIVDIGLNYIGYVAEMENTKATNSSFLESGEHIRAIVPR